MIISKKKRLGLGLASMALAASTMVGSAGADPQQYSAFVGVGSDTTQDVMNAMAGYSNGIQYTPIASNASTNPATQGSFQIISFDALKPAYVGDNCITAKLNGPSFYRPNGSSAGRKALFASRGGSTVGWTGSGGCGTGVSLSGQVDFARSSSLGSESGTQTTYIPFGRDAITFVAYRPGNPSSPITTLSLQQLQQIHSSTPGSRVSVGGVTMIPCGIQTNSGTFQFWVRDVLGFPLTGGTNATETAATDECNTAGVTGRLQESDGPALEAKGVALDATRTDDFQVIIGFSAAAYAAKFNGVAEPAPGANVKFGSISDNGSAVNLGAPLSLNAQNKLVPEPTFYADAKFGRLVYNVLPTTVATGPGNVAMKQLFVGSTSKVCQNTAVINTFGFLATPDCGITTIQRGWTTGTS